MISVNNLELSFDNLSIINGISFEVAKGERVALIGPGGCGKSTVLKVILGLLTPRHGDIKLFGCDMVLSSETEKQQTLKRVGVAFQQGALFDYMTVEQNIDFAMEHMTDLTLDERMARITELLAMVKLPRTRHQFPYELSGGMKRRIGIARALATEPSVAIFDEPTSGLDPVTSTIILNMILEMGHKRPETTLLVSTTSVEVAIRFCDRVIIMKDGKIEADDDWHHLIVDGSEWVKNFLATRLIGVDIEYARELGLPKRFIDKYW